MEKNNIIRCSYLQIHFNSNKFYALLNTICSKVYVHTHTNFIFKVPKLNLVFVGFQTGLNSLQTKFSKSHRITKTLQANAHKNRRLCLPHNHIYY